MTDSLLCAQGLSLARGPVTVLQDIDLEAQAGSIVSILGPNCAGKSTLLRAFAGLLPYRGSVLIDGRDAASLSRLQRARLLTFVPQRSHLEAQLKVRTVVSHGRYAHRTGLDRLSTRDHGVIDDAMERAGVHSLRDRDFTQLSYGEQRRVLLARALATEARILLLDEPTASLDIPHALNLYSTMRRLAAEGHLIVVVLHELDAALRHTDQALLLKAGRVAAQGASANVVTAEHVRHVYGVELVHDAALGFRLPAEQAP